MEWIVQLPILFFSIMIHEVSHGWVAARHGDPTARQAGRLTLNPIPHIDLFGTVLLPLFCKLISLPMIGWAKPVPVDAQKLAGPRWSLLLVALVGPLANLALSFCAALLFKFTGIVPGFFPNFQLTLRNALLFAVSINLVLAFFNLIPIHPLDGSKVLGQLLPEKARARYMKHAPYGFMIIVFLVAMGYLHSLVAKPSLAALELYRRMGLIW